MSSTLFSVLIRLRRMHEMQTIVTNVRGVCPSVSQSVRHAAQLGFTVRGHSVQTLANHFSRLL